MLYLLYLLLSKEVKSLKVTLCCYYGCRDMEGVLRCIKKNGNSLEHLEFARTSLLRMDPLLFRNVLTSATRLTSLVVKNICSDAMLKLIGRHCSALQYLDISSSKQVSDLGIESLCCQVQIVDKRADLLAPPATVGGGVGEEGGGGGGSDGGGSGGGGLKAGSSASDLTCYHHLHVHSQSCYERLAMMMGPPDRDLIVREDFGTSGANGSRLLRGRGTSGLGGCMSGGRVGVSIPSWKDFRQRVRNCFANATGGGNRRAIFCGWGRHVILLINFFLCTHISGVELQGLVEGKNAWLR